MAFEFGQKARTALGSVAQIRTSPIHHSLSYLTVLSEMYEYMIGLKLVAMEAVAGGVLRSETLNPYALRYT